MQNFQATYSSKIGSAAFSIKKAVVAGSKLNCSLTYTVGEAGIDDSGSIKILFRIVTDAGTPQFSHPRADNFVSFTCSNKELKIIPVSAATGFPGKLHTRPWCKGMQLILKNAHSSAGEKITINFHNWHIQTFTEKKFGIKILVDPFATNNFIELPEIINLEIVPDKPKKLVIIAPTLVKTREEFKLLFKLEDKWGNPCTSSNESITILENRNFSKLPKKIGLKNGRALVTARISDQVGFVKARFRNKTFTSNPIVAQKKGINHFWADLHGQTVETVGSGTIEEYFDFAKNFSLLDVSAHQGNDFQISQHFWKKINQLAKKLTKDDQFVVFPGYEWSGNSSKGGDRNVLFFNDGEKIFRSSHALVDDFSDLDTDAPTVKDLFQKLKNKKAIVIAHVGGRYAELINHDEKLEKLVEVHSVWGTFEWILFEALAKNMKVGIVANSDGHDGRVGSSYPGLSEFNNYGGLTCILAEKLTRKSIFNALQNRHCYATTGTRIFIDQKLIVANQRFLMGDEIMADNQSAELQLKTVGTNCVEKIEVFDGKKVIHQWFPDIEIDNKKNGVKILWQGSAVKGRNRKINWRGSIKTKKKAIIVRKINFFNPDHKIKADNNEIVFSGATTGGVQGLVIRIDNLGDELVAQINGKDIRLKVTDLNQEATAIKFPGLDAKLEISRVGISESNELIELNIPIKLKKQHQFFTKITQADGHMAWTSPFFVN